VNAGSVILASLSVNSAPQLGNATILNSGTIVTASVETTDTGGELFSTISPETTAAKPTTIATTTSTPTSSAPAGTPTPVGAQAPDVSDLALSVLSNPVGLKTVTHEQPLPPKVTTPLIPGLLSRFQTVNLGSPQTLTNTLSYGFTLSGGDGQ